MYSSLAHRADIEPRTLHCQSFPEAQTFGGKAGDATTSTAYGRARKGEAWRVSASSSTGGLLAPRRRGGDAYWVVRGPRRRKAQRRAPVALPFPERTLAMFSTTTYIIRVATAADGPALRRLTE